MEVLFCEPHLHEALPGEDIRGAAIVDEDPTNIISREVYIIFPNVCSNDEGIIVWVMLEPEVGFGEGNWDVGPGVRKCLPSQTCETVRRYSFL